MSDVLSILLVEDDQDFQDIVVPALESAGFKVRSALDAKTASQMIGAEKFDLYIVDGILPDTDGVTWVSELRRAGDATRIIFITAYGQDSNSFSWMTGKMVDQVVLKPVDPSRLAEVASQVLGVDHPASASARARRVTEKMRDLRAKYGKKLPELGAHLVALITQVAQGEWNPELIGEIRIAAHKIRGTAGTYGFIQASESAGLIEDIVTESPRDGGSDAAGLFKRLEPAAETLQQAIAESMADLAEESAS